MKKDNKELLIWLKEMYVKAYFNNFNWKKIYPNNMSNNPLSGIYTDMFFEREGKYMYLKYSIQYMSRCDKNGMSHPEEGVKYYVLHELRANDLDSIFQIPEPSKEADHKNCLNKLVNNYGRFHHVFDDEETAKSVVSRALLGIIYPYLYLLNEEEITDWNKYIESMPIEL